MFIARASADDSSLELSDLFYTNMALLTERQTSWVHEAINMALLWSENSKTWRLQTERELKNMALLTERKLKRVCLTPEEQDVYSPGVSKDSSLQRSDMFHPNMALLTERQTSWVHEAINMALLWSENSKTWRLLTERELKQVCLLRRSKMFIARASPRTPRSRGATCFIPTWRS